MGSVLASSFWSGSSSGKFFVVGGEGGKMWIWDMLQIENRNFQLQSFSFFLFVFLFLSNMGGLFIFLSQSFLNKFSTSLLLSTIFFWVFSYLPCFMTQKEKLTLFLVGDMKFPALSFLLSNIEILTQFFRPITLSARLWVNIWVGHLLTSAISFVTIVSFFQKSFWSIFLIALQGGFFLFETGIMVLQTFVFSYLVFVYFQENFTHSSLS